MLFRDRRIELRNALPFLVWLGALIIALNSGWVVAYRLLYLFTILIALGFMWSGGAVLAISIDREPVNRVAHVGEVLVERILVRNRSYLPQMWVVIEDSSELPQHAIRQVMSYMGPRSQRHFILRTIGLRRGRYRLGPTLLTAGDPFGIFRARRRIASSHSVTVYPRIFALESLALLAGVFQVDSRRARRSREPTTDVSTIREYQPGDEFARIHWLSTARQGQLMSKEFEHNPGGDIWIVLDMYARAHAGRHLSPDEMGEMYVPLQRDGWPPLEPATEEYSVSMAASVAAHFIRSDRALGFLAYSQTRELVQPDRGERHLNRIYDLLAELRADGNVPLAKVLEREAHNFRRFDTVVVITPSTDEDWVAATHALALRGMRALAIVIDRDSFADYPSGNNVQDLLSARRLPYCLIEKGQRPETAICTVY